MHANIVINDDLMAQALKATGFETKKEVIAQDFKLFIRHPGLKSAYSKT